MDESVYERLAHLYGFDYGTAFLNEKFNLIPQHYNNFQICGCPACACTGVHDSELDEKQGALVLLGYIILDMGFH